MLSITEAIMKNNVLHFYAGLTLLLTLLVLALIFHAPHFTFHTPLSYTGDGLFSSGVVKTILDTGWFLTNPHMGAPYIYSLADFPGFGFTNALLIKGLSYFNHNSYPVIINLFYFLSFFLTALSAFYVFCYLGLKHFSAVVGSILFTFLPTHFSRGEEHIALSLYYVIPIFTLFCFEVFNDFSFIGDKKSSYIKQFFYFILCIFATATDTYYAFFGAFFIFLTGVISGINAKKWMPFLNSLIFLAIIFFTTAVNLAPNLILQNKYGHNYEVANRQPYDAENFALKINDLLFPVDGHRLDALKNFKKNYRSLTQIQSEGNYIGGGLGILGSLGFLFLIFFIFIKRKLLWENIRTIYLLSALNMGGTLLATVGGFGAVLAYLVFPQIRSYTRMSIYLGFFSFAAFFLVLQHIASRKKLSNYTQIIVCIGLLIFGLLDQIPNHISPLMMHTSADDEKFKSDSIFVKKIEQLLPNNAMVYQLPYISFPEDPIGYAPLSLYLQSHTLRWSYGGTRGRGVAQWQEAVSKKPTPHLLAELSYAGFSGLTIDRHLYQRQHAKNKDIQLEQELITLLHEQPIVSPDKQLVFFDIRSYAENLKKSLSVQTWKEHANKAHIEIYTSVKLIKGFNRLSNTANFEAAGKHGTLRIVNYTEKPMVFKISFIAKTKNTNYSTLTLADKITNEKILINKNGTSVNRTLTSLPGKNDIFFKSDEQFTIANFKAALDN